MEATAAQLSLSWVNAANDEDGFKIEWRLAPGTFTQMTAESAGASAKQMIVPC